jgi:hypothetical protein
MKIGKSYYVGTNENSFRSSEPAEIISILTCYPEKDIPRVCFEVKYADGKIDYCPVSDVENYKIFTENYIGLKYNIIY